MSVKSSEFIPECTLVGMKYLRDKAGRERDLRELYRGRAPYELLQNADDAQASIAVFALCTDGKAFAHNGRWFTVDIFRCLADGWSDKNPKECIGHKGLGFRSVLDITPSPHLIRIDSDASHGFFAVKFCWATNNGHIQETLRQQPDLRLKNTNPAFPFSILGRPATYILSFPDAIGSGVFTVGRFQHRG